MTTRLVVPVFVANLAFASSPIDQADSAPEATNPHFVSGLAAADPDF